MPHLPPSAFDSFAYVDAAVAGWVRSHSGAALTAFMGAVSLVHSQAVLWAFAAVFALYAWKRGERQWARITIIVVPAGLLLNTLLKLVFARARPVLDGVASSYDTYSFPSGHAAGSTLVYGLLAAYIASHTSRPGLRWLAFAAAAAMIVLVASSRLVLGVHFASDVAGGVAWAALWVWLWIAILAPKRRLPRAEP
ncbi:MAG TPA: phosphatase PAP2 family protein [Usitatibacter sp.]|jgi:undecaprenyl-diphosphatase|nr:phosphatase PAP2 family protein [Usitatibacter sp.]